MAGYHLNVVMAHSQQEHSQKGLNLIKLTSKFFPFLHLQ